MYSLFFSHSLKPNSSILQLTYFIIYTESFSINNNSRKIQAELTFIHKWTFLNEHFYDTRPLPHFFSSCEQLICEYYGILQVIFTRIDRPQCSRLIQINFAFSFPLNKWLRFETAKLNLFQWKLEQTYPQWLSIHVPKVVAKYAHKHELKVVWAKICPPGLYVGLHRRELVFPLILKGQHTGWVWEGGCAPYPEEEILICWKSQVNKMIQFGTYSRLHNA